MAPKQLGKLREEDPAGIAFIERHIIWVHEEQQKAHEEAERKAKASRGRRR